jgi:hypothetical protein
VSQRDPRAPSAIDPEEAKRAALGWKNCYSTRRMSRETHQKTTVKQALFKNMTPAVTCAACLMIETLTNAGNQTMTLR